MNTVILSKWDELSNQLYSFVAKKIRNEEAAKDIVQEVFVKVHSKIHTLKDSSKINSWIFQITRNLIHDYFRNLKSSYTQSSSMEVSIEYSRDETVELAGCMLLMIDLLPEKYKEAVMLADIEGLSQKELAERLQLSYSGAKSRVQRGREKLKDLYLQCCTINADRYGNILEYHKNVRPTDCK